MPTSEDILVGLGTIANDGVLFAAAWHFALLLVLVAVARGWRPSRRTAATALSLPLASVAAFAWAYGNPFNGLVFAALALALAALARRLDREPVTRGASWAVVAGALMVAFGWVYPHFVQVDSAAAYLYAAPTGLIPCPTLSVVIGLALLAGLSDRAWSTLTAAAGLLYGLFGTFRLGVTLDAALLAGALALLVPAWRPHLRLPAHPTGGVRHHKQTN
ncbi:MAG: hypothetical protein KC583_19700 [Myxococcales bacterium]|nr:hypothetical protein [Myxococcales bacterium]